MIGEMSFKYLNFLTVLPRDIYRNPIKSQSKIGCNLEWLNISAKKLRHRYLTGF